MAAAMADLRAYLLEENVEGASGDVVGLPEDGVEGGEAEDGGPGGGDAPGDDGGEPLQAGLPLVAAAEHVLRHAVDRLAVALQLRLGHVEQRRQLHGEI